MEKDRDWKKEPKIQTAQAATIFCCGKPAFRDMFRRRLHKQIRYLDKQNGRFYLLTDVLRAAYPEADSASIHCMAIQVCWLYKKDRKEKRGGNHHDMV